MMRRILSVVILLSIFLAAGPAAGQASNWTAWLYASEQGRMFLVDEGGRLLEDFVLPSLVGYTRYAGSAAVSHNGALIAYTVYNPDTQGSQLMVYDTVTDRVIVTLDLGAMFFDTIDLLPESQLFNPFDTALAYGYNLFDQGWQVVVIDLLSGTVTFRLSSSDATIQALQIDSFLTPVIQHYSAAEVSITMIAGGTEGGIAHNGYRWNLLNNLVIPESTYPTPAVSTFEPTGETIMAVFDERLPNRINTLEVPFQWNALHVYDPAQGTRTPFFGSESWTLEAPVFIQGGERILVNAFDFETQVNLWTVIERDGTVAGFVPIQPNHLGGIRGVSDGFVYVSAESGESILYHSITRDVFNTGRPIWSAPAGSTALILWAKDLRDAEADQTLFTPWRQLAAPIFSADAFISPSDVPTPTPFVNSRVLTIGGTAVITTTEGDRLRVRSGPGIAFAIVAEATPGTRVVILEGPRSADGLTWWRLRLPDGAEGWAVESADGIQTLVPSGG